MKKMYFHFIKKRSYPLWMIYLFSKMMVFSQCFPTIFIDGTEVPVGQSDIFTTQTPYWLKAGQTLAAGYGVSSISVIEFSVNVTSLEFISVLSVTNTSSSPATVPSGKVWKIESFSKNLYLLTANTFSFTSNGTFTPPCSGFYKIQVWGAGGGGGGYSTMGTGYSGAGGGGGGYAEGTYYLSKNYTYSIVVGAGGIGGVSGSSVTCGTDGGRSYITLNNFVLISATGGGRGCGGSGGSGGTGGFGQVTYPGESSSATGGGKAPLTTYNNAANGCPPQNGGFPGGGGGGSSCLTTNGGNGGNGLVVISIDIKK